MKNKYKTIWTVACLSLIVLGISGYLLFQEKSPLIAKEVVSQESAQAVETLLVEPNNQVVASAESQRLVADKVVMDISDWPEFVKAFSDPSVDIINVTADFYVPERTINLTQSQANSGMFDYAYDLSEYLERDNTNSQGGNTYTHLRKAGIARKVIIEGNDHLFDFGALSLLFVDANLTGIPTGEGWDITWQNLTMYHGNIYGFTTLNDLNATNQKKSVIRYHNVVDYGSQMMHSPSTDVVVSGVTKNLQMANYTTPFRSWRVGNDNQINLMITNLHLEEEADFELYSLTAGNIWLQSGGTLTMDKNSKMKVRGNPTGTGEGDGSQVGLYVDGNLILEEGAELTMIPKNTYSAISLSSRNSLLSIGKNATVKIESTNHTDNSDYINRNILYMSGGSSLSVSEGGMLDIEATGMGTSNSNIIHVDGSGKFFIDKKGSLRIRSDSTSNSQSLLNFTNNSSEFRFKDAELLDLHRTAEISGTATTNGLINIAGSGGLLDVDIQKASWWARSNLSETPTREWTPMYDMKLIYNGTTPTIQSASSLTLENVNDFKANFTTKNTQRVKFEYIPDVEVNLLSMATDEVSSDNSQIITGMANPNIYIRLSSAPIVSSDTPEINPANNAVVSPVTGGSTNPEFTANFTTMTDDQGNFSFKLPEGTHFKAGSTIRAFAFLNGKTDSVEQVVKDVTPPTGDPQTYHAVLNGAVPNPQGFVTNPRDSHPLEQAFTYAYSEETPASAVGAMMLIPGEHDVSVNLFDEAGNMTTIDSKLVVHATATDINALDIEIAMKELKVMSANELKSHILTESHASALVVVNGTFRDLTDQLEVAQLSGLTPNSPAGEYLITLVIKAVDSGLASDLTYQLTVTVVPSVGEIRVEFVNEANLSIAEPIIIEGDIETVVDLRQEELVLTSLSEIALRNYELTSRPTSELVEVAVTQTTVTYHFSGMLLIESAPEIIDFGSHQNSLTGTKVADAVVDKPLIIWDNRVNLRNWTLTLTLEVPLTHQADQSKILSEAIRYQNDQAEIILTDDAQMIERQTHDQPGRVILSDAWGAGMNGLKLEVAPGAVRKLGDYQGIILWKLGDTP